MAVERGGRRERDESAFKFADLFKGRPTPELHLVLQPTGGGTGVDFADVISEVGNRVPAMGVHFYAELEDEGVVYERAPFNLSAGQIDHYINFAIERPTERWWRRATTPRRSTVGR